MTMKLKFEAFVPAGDALTVGLANAYKFAGIHCAPYAMLFSGKRPDGSTEFFNLSFEDGLAQPLTMLDADPESLTSTLEQILWHKIDRDLPGTKGSKQFLEAFRSEFRERFGRESPWATRQLAMDANKVDSSPERIHV